MSGMKRMILFPFLRQFYYFSYASVKNSWLDDAKCACKSKALQICSKKCVQKRSMRIKRGKNSGGP